LSEISLEIKNLDVNPQFDSVLFAGFKHIYKNGIIPDSKIIGFEGEEILGFKYIQVRLDKTSYDELVSNIYTTATANKYIRNLFVDKELNVDNSKIDSVISSINLSDFIIPNLIYDKQATQVLHENVINSLSPTKGMFYTGELIVNRGEIITSEIEQLLDSYKAEFEQNMGYSVGTNWRLWLGYSILSLIILLLFYFSIYFVDFEIIRERNKFNFYFCNCFNFLITVFVRNFNAQYLFLVPFAVFALYMKAFFKAILVFPLYMISLIPLLVVAEFGIELYILNVLSGGIALVSFAFLNRGWLQFLNSLLLFLGMFIVHYAFRQLESVAFESINYTIIMYIFFNALFVVATYPLVFLFEKIFSLVSVSTLRDLSDTNNRLLQELSRKAPGTFQHSLQVANLAERAVRSIGGDTRLAKVGAMYHDVGKINNPQCFIENQAHGVDYHKGLSPIESAREIIKHVADGVELAKKFRLPQIIIDYITSHHAHSQTGYFYMQYCNQGGDPENIGEFTYQGTLPTTKEQVVVMMADAVEAASRTLKDYSVESISALVNNITKQRIADSQLVKADISIKEINIVRAVFIKHLQEIYHARIAYPTKNKDVLRDVRVENDSE
jgi:uncharacterized domain HDIG